ncbi:MAG: hypothetical protein IPL86_02910 [Flavobacteriales bacterium]|nr:hypothetical protein [Flavobacteriales bacterium]
MEPGSNQNSQVTQPLLERTVAERLEHLRESGTYGADRYLEAMQNITSEAIVPTGLDLKYRAGEEVRLTPGFHAEPGTRFHAFIHPADAPGNSFHPKAMQAGAPEAEIENESVDVGMELYPNPANGSFHSTGQFHLGEWNSDHSSIWPYRQFGIVIGNAWAAAVYRFQWLAWPLAGCG